MADAGSPSRTSEDLLDYVRIDLTEAGGTRSMVECDKERLLGLLERLTRSEKEPSELLEAVRGWVHARAYADYLGLLDAEHRLNETFRKVVGLDHQLHERRD